MDMRERNAEAEARELTYSFLSHLFLEEVSEDFLARLAEEPPSLEGELGRYAAGLAGANLAAARTEAAAEFAALLLNMSADPVFPYESVYTSAEHLLMQRSRDEVLAAYRAQGFERSGDLNVPEDHAGIELAFMARLCRKEADALAAGDEVGAEAARETQRVFLRDHVLAWFPQLCADLEKRAKRGLYRGLAETVRQFLAFEREELGGRSLPPPPPPPPYPRAPRGRPSLPPGSAVRGLALCGPVRQAGRGMLSYDDTTWRMKVGDYPSVSAANQTVQITIDSDSGIPLWLQLRNRLIYLIASGRFKAGDKLPTVRELAVDLGVNYNTVSKVYQDIERDGYIVSKRGKGTFVVERGPAEAEAAKSEVDFLADEFIRQCRELGVPRQDIADLVAGRLAAADETE